LPSIEEKDWISFIKFIEYRPENKIFEPSFKLLLHTLVSIEWGLRPVPLPVPLPVKLLFQSEINNYQTDREKKIKFLFWKKIWKLNGERKVSYRGPVYTRQFKLDNNQKKVLKFLFDLCQDSSKNEHNIDPHESSDLTSCFLYNLLSSCEKNESSSLEIESSDFLKCLKEYLEKVKNIENLLPFLRRIYLLYTALYKTDEIINNTPETNEIVDIKEVDISSVIKELEINDYEINDYEINYQIKENNDEIIDVYIKDLSMLKVYKSPTKNEFLKFFETKEKKNQNEKKNQILTPLDLSPDTIKKKDDIFQKMMDEKDEKDFLIDNIIPPLLPLPHLLPLPYNFNTLLNCSTKLRYLLYLFILYFKTYISNLFFLFSIIFFVFYYFIFVQMCRM
jgi:hypothetical protein